MSRAQQIEHFMVEMEYWVFCEIEGGCMSRGRVQAERLAC